MQPPPASSNSFKKSNTLDIGIPGVKKVLSSKTNLWKRIVWFIIFIACTAAVIYQLTDRISYYVSTPTSMNVVITENNSITFPSISICPSPQTSVVVTAILHAGFAYDERNGNLTTERCLTQEEFATYNLKFNVLPDIDMDKFWKAYNINESGIETKVKHPQFFEDFMVQKPIRSTSKQTDVPWGKCLTINLDEAVPLYGGTSVHITMNQSKLLPALQNYSDCLEEVLGIGDFLRIGKSLTFYIVVNNLNTPLPNGYIDLNFYEVVFGQEVVFRLNSKEFFRKPTPKHPCEADWKTSYEEYEICMRDKFAELKSDCRTPFDKINEKKPCDQPRTYMSTWIQQLLYMLQEKDYFEDCNQLKKTFCHELKYSLEHKLTTNLTEKQLLRMKIAIHDKYFEAIQEQYIYDFSALISDVGGSVGLFFGACVLTILEIFEITFAKLAAVVKKRRNVCEIV